MRLLSLTDVRSSLTAYLHSHSVRSCAGELPLSRQTNASGASAAYESMEGLPVSTKTVGGGKAGGISSDVTLSSTRQPALAEPGSVSLDLERGLQGQDAQGHDAGLAAAPSGLNRFMDALLGPVAEDMLYRAAPEVFLVALDHFCTKKSSWRVCLLLLPPRRMRGLGCNVATGVPGACCCKAAVSWVSNSCQVGGSEALHKL
eukprot:scaffold26676_cov17-Tisochrysis_lutea.AAC.1